AAQQLERIDQQRFAGAGLARENVEPGSRLDRELFDDRQIPHFEIRDHPEKSTSASRLLLMRCMRRMVMLFMAIAAACSKVETVKQSTTQSVKKAVGISVPYDNLREDAAAREKQRFDAEHRQLAAFREQQQQLQQQQQQAAQQAQAAQPPAGSQFGPTKKKESYKD